RSRGDRPPVADGHDSVSAGYFFREIECDGNMNRRNVSIGLNWRVISFREFRWKRLRAGDFSPGASRGAVLRRRGRDRAAEGPSVTAPSAGGRSAAAPV